MKTTQELLQLNNDDYRQRIFTHWHQWCVEWSQSSRDAQKLMTCPALYRWWIGNYNRINAKFEARMHSFHNKVSVELCDDFHTECLSILFDYYSKPLMRIARNQEPIEPQMN